MNSDFLKFAHDVEKIHGVPVILSRYGFKKIQVDGKTYLEPMTKDELAEVLSKTGQLNIPELLPGSVCLGGAMGCITDSECRVCRPYNNYGTFYCLCG